MATLPDMQRGFERTFPNRSIQWLVSSRPVVAQFEQQGTQGLQHLGMPLSHNGETDVLVLWIGFREDTRELLVTLTIRLNLNPERHIRKQTPRKGRLMFMVIPVESLLIRCTSVAYHDLVKNPALEPFLDLPSDHESASCRISKIKVDTDTKSFVIMPEEPVTGRQSKHSRQSVDLLDRLKSLSEVTDFFLFTNHDPIFQQAIEHVQKKLQQDTLPVITPDIQYRAFYPGRRKAAVDLWAHQGWHPKREGCDRLKKDPHDNALPCIRMSAKRKAIDVADQTFASLPASSPPPEYAACASHLVHSASSLCLPQLPDEQDQTSINSDARNISNCTDTFSAAVFTHERVFSSRPSPPPLPSASPLSSDYSADLLSENFSRGSHIATPCEFGASIQVVRSSSLLHGRAVSPVGAVSPSSIVAATPCKRRLTNSDGGSGIVNTPASPSHLSHNDPLGFSDPYQRNLLYLMQIGAHVSSTVADEASAHSMVLPSIPSELSDTASHSIYHRSSHIESAEDGDDTPSLETRLTQWIIQAWLICPDLHYLFIEGLLALGQEVSKNSTRAFDDRRIAVTCSLLRYCAEQISNRNVTVQTRMLPHDQHNIPAVLPRMISWLYTLEPQVSLTAFVDLLRLSQLERRMLSSKDGLKENYKEYMGECACIVSRACVLASQQERRSDLGMRMMRMLQERGRSV